MFHCRRAIIHAGLAALLGVTVGCADGGRKIHQGLNTRYLPPADAAPPAAPAPVKQPVTPSDPLAQSGNNPVTHASDELALAAAMAPDDVDDSTLPRGPERGDGWLTLRIRSMLLMRSNVSGAKTHVTVRDGIVTLTGEAATSAQKELTEKYARGVEGVRGVKNEMTLASVEPAASTD